MPFFFPIFINLIFDTKESGFKDLHYILLEMMNKYKNLSYNFKFEC
jgi:hypothetical protein